MNDLTRSQRPLGALLAALALLALASPLEGANPEGCLARASCNQRDRRLELGADKRACQCDQRCVHYGDCCADAAWAPPQPERTREIQRRRRQWHCHRVNPIFGGVLLKASCAPDWLEGPAGGQSLVARRLVQRRCEYVKDRGKAQANRADLAEQLADPLGTMMPITDLTSAITYANSYCLQCNQLAATNASRLIYWPPMLECNYNREQDDRNTLIDLISARKGRVLQFSAQRARWLIQADQEASNSTLKSAERQCTITPSVPESVDRLIRHCRSSTIDTCAPTVGLPDSERLQRDCLFGHQSLAYSSTGDQVYFNPSCARCNGEQQPLCEPQRPKSFVAPPSKMVVLGRQENGSEASFSPTSTDEPEDTTGASALNPDSARSGNIAGSHIQGAQISGSFTVLLDLYGASQNDEQVGAVHQCPDAQAQVFDPFFLTCRDVVCGLNHQFADGRCVPVVQPEDQPSNLGGLAGMSGPMRGQMGRLESPQPQQMQRDEFARPEGSNSSSAAAASSPTPARQTSTSSSGLAGSSSIEVASKNVSTATTTARPSSPTGQTLLDLPSPADAQSSKRVRVSSQLEVEQLTGSQSERPTSARLEAAQVAQTGANQQLQREKEGEDIKRAIAAEQLELEQQFQSAIVKLNANDLPQPTSQSRLQFAECGKILVDPNQYRLFSVREQAANRSERTDQSEKFLSIQLLAEQASQLHRQRQRHQQQHQAQPDEQAAESRQSGEQLYAFVHPYNLTLASSQFELVRHRKTSGEPAGPDGHFSLLICSPFSTDLVDKFKPAMATLTSICLLVSIASLLLYLFLYCLSMFDLRHLQLEMSNWELLRQRESGTMENLKRASRDSNETGSLNLSSSCTRSQSLSSRGVACLASSLLFAYLLFILGHQQSPASSHPETSPEGAQVAPVCLALAVATYYCFLFAFSWMLLLAYDIWRTLRLATCQLRAPANHAQSRRFLSYMLLALIWPALIVATPLLFDLLPLTCDQPTSVQPYEDTDSRLPSSAGANCSQLMSATERFVRLYRPKFGHQPTSCWFSNRRSLALFFGLPVALIMVLNLLFFLHSSFMVIRTSSRSSRKFASSSTNSAKSARAAREVAESARRNSASHSAQTDFSQLNSLTASSMLSIQSRTSCSSTSSSSGDDSPPPQKPPQQQPPAAAAAAAATRNPRRPLESSISSHSIGSANSIMSSTLTGIKSESSQVKALSCVLSSVARDYRLYCRLSTIMGLTWLTGLMASLVDASSALWYLFVLLNTLQGLFIFIAFGCKRSKLANLHILCAYLRYRIARLLAARESAPNLIN